MRKNIVFIVLATFFLLAPLPALAEENTPWHGTYEIDVTCEGWTVTIDPTWNGQVGTITQKENLEGTWTEGQESVEWSVTVEWHDSEGNLLDVWTAQGLLNKPEECSPTGITLIGMGGGYATPPWAAPLILMAFFVIIAVTLLVMRRRVTKKSLTR